MNDDERYDDDHMLVIQVMTCLYCKIIKRY